jgi:hypothetical protein
MFPVKVDPGWYDAYWNSDRPQPKRKSLAGGLVRFAVLVGLLASSGVALGWFELHGNAGRPQSWEQE